ncbi:nuclear transport factor 2 family protein [Catenulispora pinisilvae]|uniref:nuclear transport factor 2 family protein n=1 Tax=Catenulispora pinisilvae TaxID=2705253 RepID=UPI00189271F5|nr:nuclear transport factor 2 family protein [Catenulispora pinisilvae]
MNAATTLPEIAIAWAAAWNGDNADALGALFTTDGTYTDHAIGATMTGQEQISGWKARTDAMIDDAAVKLVTAYRSGNRVTIEAVYAGHIKGAPTPFAVPMATLLDTRDDLLITADRDYYSLAAVLAQSGLPADWTPAS